MVDRTSKPEIMSQWESGISHELGFWEHWLRSRGDRWPEEFQQRRDPLAPLQDHIRQYLDPRADRVTLLDVGAGPLTILGKVWPGHRVEITAVDALAEDYGRLLSECGITPPVPTMACQSERLLEKFAPEQFDLVHVRNALDHGLDPLRAVDQMLAVVKTGHHVLMHHAINEGEKANYEGFHQWNLAVEGHDMVIWNRSGRHSLRAHVKGRAELVQISPESEDWSTVVLQKTP